MVLFNDGIEELLFGLLKLFGGLIIADLFHGADDFELSNFVDRVDVVHPP